MCVIRIKVLPYNGSIGGPVGVSPVPLVPYNFARLNIVADTPSHEWGSTRFHPLRFWPSGAMSWARPSPHLTDNAYSINYQYSWLLFD